MAKVEIYTKAYCPYCIRAKALLEQKSVAYQEIKIDFDAQLRDVMISRSQGGYTVPQIFINDKHIGGCDQLVELEMAQQLDSLLSEQATA
ncbi:glutaredoxin 3 [Litorilituus sediminis]|uniref:Glutaredoxin n=1 Tax=Litorilituus sediminis TaxID=718192 RepID=A0A4P6P4P8_9GAMM|nr:glutaredoxin 3 [Litorilituus sediminis]QBG36646.1 glutaredoxin 3 [Litorilituus sediminis]